MTKCPYVPPHPWNVDFPHLMLRAKAHRFRNGRSPPRDRLLTSTDAVGKLATIPVVVQAVNKANATPVARKVMQGVLGIGAGRVAAAVRVDALSLVGRAVAAVAGAQRRAHAGQGRDLLDLLRQLQRAGHRPRPRQAARRTTQVPYALVESEVCCGMPKLEIGDLASVEALKNANIPVLARARARGLRDPDAGAVVHADVQAGAAAAVSGGRRRRRRSPTRCSIRSSISCCATRTGCSNKAFKRAARQGQLSHPLPFARAERRPEDPRSAGMDSRTRRSTRSSAAPATTARGA